MRGAHGRGASPACMQGPKRTRRDATMSKGNGANGWQAHAALDAEAERTLRLLEREAALREAQRRAERQAHARVRAALLRLYGA